MRASIAGLRVLVTRSTSQASDLSDRLSLLGAIPIEIATIEIAEPSDGGAAMLASVKNLSTYSWVVLASPNGARVFVAAAGSAAQPPADLTPPIACVGPSTAGVVAEAGYTVDLVPDRFVAEALVDRLPEPTQQGQSVLLVQAEVTRPVLAEGLEARGWQVDQVAAYRTIDAEVSDEDRARAVGADVVTFTSSSTVERFVRLIGLDAVPPAVACIGPITSATARELGVKVDIEAPVHTLDGLVDALVLWAESNAD